jgi:hypothetical protein
MEQIIAFQIDYAALVARDVSGFRDVCSPTLPADELKSHRGKCVIVFPMYDNDSREVWAIPEARRYIQAVDREFPHWPYFLVPDFKLWHLMLWLVCMIEVRIKKGGIQYNSEEAVDFLVTRLEDIRKFCVTISDDYEAVTSCMLGGIPDELARPVRSRLGDAGNDANVG